MLYLAINCRESPTSKRMNYKSKKHENTTIFLPFGHASSAQLHSVQLYSNTGQSTASSNMTSRPHLCASTFDKHSHVRERVVVAAVSHDSYAHGTMLHSLNPHSALAGHVIDLRSCSVHTPLFPKLHVQTPRWNIVVS